MEIYYLNKGEFLESVQRKSLESFTDGREYLSDEKFLEHLCGIFLTKFVAKNFYGVEDLEIEYRNGKPFFKTGKMFFSISHSKDIVLVGFSNRNIGVDVEYMSQRNFKAVMNRYGYEMENPSPKDFYRFWTLHEAEFKLGANYISKFSSILEREYFVSCVSDSVLTGSFVCQNLKCLNQELDLVKEFNNPKNLIISSS